jgi:hypothetical protein
MKNTIENNNKSVLQKNTYEEIADITETIAEGAVIDGAENFEENSIVELDLKDFEELGAVNNNYLKSMTIIDEFENDLAEKNILSKRYDNSTNSINLEQFTIQIDSLTSVKKRKNIIMPPKVIVSPEVEKVQEAKNEIKKGFNEEINEEITHNEITAIKEEVDEIKKKIASESGVEQKIYVQENVKEEVLEKIGEKLLERVLEKLEEKKEEKESKSNIIDIYDFPESELNKSSQDNIQDTIHESRHENLQDEKVAEEEKKEEISKYLKGNSITIEIPDKLLGRMPAGFNIDELGKIDLNEADIIAEEDLLYLTKGDLLEELEGLNLMPEQDKDAQNKKEKIDPKIKLKKLQKKTVEKKDIVKEEKVEYEKIEKTAKTENIEDKTEKKADQTEPAAEKIKQEKFKPESIPSAKKEKIDTVVETPETVIEIKAPPIESTPNVDTKIDIQFTQNTLGKEIKDENVFIIDNNNFNKTDAHIRTSGIDDLEDITSTAVDVIGGKAKQLTESETSDRKAVTGLIRDNYPTFKDLLKEKDIKDKHLYSDEDMTFIDNSFLNIDQTKKVLKSKDSPEKIIKQKITSSYEQTLGLIPDELELIENQLFSRKIDLFKTTSKKAGLDQHPSDTIALNKYKYIIPVPDSLLDHEKKSIEDDITTESALILEEDVAKIKKKLDDSMKKEIAVTINDITDKITVYEDNKNKKESNEDDLKDKEEIKKLLSYLNDLFEKLPEENIKHFADSEYYELYKKFL